jgi:hypothetical protein
VERRKGANTRTSIIVEKTRRAWKNQDVRVKLEAASMIINAQGSEKRINSAIGTGRYLAQKVMQHRRLKPYRGKRSMEQPVQHWKTTWYQIRCSLMPEH